MRATATCWQSSAPGECCRISLVRVFSYLYHHSHNRLGIAHRFDPRSYAPLLAATFGGSRLVYAHFENTALYSPANYLPQIVVFWIARNVGEPIVATLFTVRLVGGLVWAALVSAAVAIVPRWKWLFSLVVLVPTALAQGSAISADSSVARPRRAERRVRAAARRSGHRAEPAPDRPAGTAGAVDRPAEVPARAGGRGDRRDRLECPRAGADRRRRAAVIGLPGLVAAASSGTSPRTPTSCPTATSSTGSGRASMSASRARSTT